MKVHINRIAFSYFLMAAIASACLAQDWPQWRGPNRDGVIPSASIPKAWPDTLKVKWKAAVGAGHSSPVVAGGRVYLHTRQDEREVVSCLDLNTGKVLWQEGYAAAYTINPAAEGHGKGPKSTPVIYNGKLYTLGISGILSCFDTRAGKLVWRKDFAGQFKHTSPLYGTAMSPVADSGLLIAHVGGQDSGALIALDAETGEVKWSWNGDGPGYASPIVVDLAGTRQIVTQSQQNIIGVSAANGALLWRIPFTTAYIQNIVTPILYKQTLIFSGLDKGTTAVKVIKRGSEYATEQVWHNPNVSMYMNSPVLVGDMLMGLSHKRKGQYFCLDAATGETRWTTTGRDGDNAAILAGAGLLFLLNNDAELTVARASAAGLEPVKKYALAQSATWAHPVIAGNRILIKDESSLALWGLE